MLQRFIGVMLAASMVFLAPHIANARGGGGGGHHSGDSHSSSGSHSYSRDHAVSGYTKHNGTYVKPSHATNPNGTKNDNYSTRGNTNPYTGKAGTKPRDGE